jgi:atrophin-1 interacting protein 3 (BAI1-associated protein 1)
MKTFKTSNENNKQNYSQRYFTLNPSELKGEFYKTTLIKTNQGFGFTIIGANETSDDYLQIKYIVPNGAAYVDGILKQGDILVYVNKQCVLGYTHQDVVEMFQSIPVGEYVELTVCRGYPLSIDPNDPNIEIKSLPAIMQLHNGNSNSNIINGGDYGDLIEEHNLTDLYNELSVSIIKGSMGFGFTIADDTLHNYQKVKQILDKERCVNLLEGDILLEINGISLINLQHNQVVDILKECKKGQETIIKLKRSLNSFKGKFSHHYLE